MQLNNLFVADSQFLNTFGSYCPRVFDTYGTYTRNDDFRFESENHSRFQFLFHTGSKYRGLVDFQADTVAKALKAWDDAPVMLTGHIVERVAGSDDKYNFRDATGTIVVEIDHEVFAGRTVTPADRVRLSGKLDKEMMDPTKVDVKVLEILK